MKKDESTRFSDNTITINLDFLLQKTDSLKESMLIKTKDEDGNKTEYNYEKESTKLYLLELMALLVDMLGYVETH